MTPAASACHSASGSNSRASRSRAVSFPSRCYFSTLAGPPPARTCSAIRSTRASSLRMCEALASPVSLLESDFTGCYS